MKVFRNKIIYHGFKINRPKSNMTLIFSALKLVLD